MGFGLAIGCAEGGTGLVAAGSDDVCLLLGGVGDG